MIVSGCLTETFSLFLRAYGQVARVRQARETNARGTRVRVRKRSFRIVIRDDLFYVI